MDETIKKKDADKAKRQDADLNQGLDETFPASDAPSATQPAGGRRHEDDQKDEKRD